MSLQLSKDVELITAAKEGKLEKVIELVMLGANVNAKDTVLFCSIILQKNPTFSSRVFVHNSWTPLHYACMNGHLLVVDYLVLKNADLNSKNFGNKTPLEVAQLSRHNNIVEYIHDHLGIKNHEQPSSPRNNISTNSATSTPTSSSALTSEPNSNRSSLTLTPSPSQAISSMNQVLYSSSPKSSPIASSVSSTSESEEKKKPKKKMTLFSSKTLKGTSATTTANLTSSKFNDSANETILFLQTQLAETTKEKNNLKLKISQLQNELDDFAKKLQDVNEAKLKQEEKYISEIEKWKLSVKLMEQQKQNLQDTINEKNMLLETSFQVNVIMEQKELIESLRKQIQAPPIDSSSNLSVPINGAVVNPPQDKDASLEKVEKMLSKVKHIRSKSKSYDLPDEQLKEIAKSIDSLLKQNKSENFDELLEDVDL